MLKEQGKIGGRWFFWLMLFVIMLLLMRDPVLCGDLIKRGGGIVLNKALPAVFPYLVLSSLFFESGFPMLFRGRVARVLGRLLSLPDICISGIVMGLFAGFPLGASFAAGLYKEGYCQKEEAERLSALSGFPSPPFLLAAFGQGVMGSPMAGVLLYFVQTVTVLLYGILLGRRSRKRKGQGGNSINEERAGRKRKPAPSHGMPAKPVPSLFSAVGQCIGAAALQMVRIGGFILAFSLLSGLILELFDPLFVRFPLLEAPVAGFFEISSGVAHMKAGGTLGMLIGGLCLSFSGLSVHMQVAGFLDPAGLSVKEHLLAHVRLCPIIAVAAAALCALFGLF